MERCGRGHRLLLLVPLLLGLSAAPARAGKRGPARGRGQAELPAPGRGPLLPAAELRSLARGLGDQRSRVGGRTPGSLGASVGTFSLLEVTGEGS